MQPLYRLTVPCQRAEAHVEAREALCDNAKRPFTLPIRLVAGMRRSLAGHVGYEEHGPALMLWSMSCSFCTTGSSSFIGSRVSISSLLSTAGRCGVFKRSLI